MDRIIGQEYKYKVTSILIPLVTLDGEECLLFQKRSKNIPQGGEICFPGGRVDKDDTSPKETAIRETVEEIGISRESIEVFYKHGTLIAPMGVVVNAFVGRLNINSVSDLSINRDEVDKVFLIPLNWFKDNPPREYSVRIEVQPHFYDKSGKKEILLPSKEIGLPERYFTPWGGINQPIFYYKTQYGPLWGLTAEITRDFIKGRY